MGDWQRYQVDLGDDGNAEVEARETASGGLEWRGLPQTTFDSWAGGDLRKPNQTVAEQVQDAASEWFHGTKMKQ